MSFQVALPMITISNTLETGIKRLLAKNGYGSFEELVRYLLHKWYEEHREKEAEA